MKGIGRCIGVLALTSAGAAAQPFNVVIMDSTSDGVEPELNVDFDLATPGIQGPGATSNDFSGLMMDFGSEMPIFLAPDAVEITFNLLPGVFVSEFAVTGEDFVGQPGGTTITFDGIDAGGNSATETLNINSAGAFSRGTTQSTMTNFASIDSVVITSFEARITRFDYVFLPTPSSLAVLGLGLGVVSRRLRA